MNKHWIWLGLAGWLVLAAGVYAQNQGEAEIIMNGGNQGNITLPHHMHQDIIDDCMVCHADFSKESGSIDAMKAAGTLKKKQVMNETCLKCHRDKKKAGEPFGPVSCSGCHVK